MLESSGRTLNNNKQLLFICETIYNPIPKSFYNLAMELQTLKFFYDLRIILSQATNIFVSLFLYFAELIQILKYDIKFL